MFSNFVENVNFCKSVSFTFMYPLFFFFLMFFFFFSKFYTRVFYTDISLARLWTSLHIEYDIFSFFYTRSVTCAGAMETNGTSAFPVSLSLARFGNVKVKCKEGGKSTNEQYQLKIPFRFPYKHSENSHHIY